MEQMVKVELTENEFNFMKLALSACIRYYSQNEPPQGHDILTVSTHVTILNQKMNQAVIDLQKQAQMVTQPVNEDVPELKNVKKGK